MSRLDEVEAEIADLDDSYSARTYTDGYADLARTLAADVDARDAVITELLAMLKPGDEPVPPADPSTLADWNLWSAHHSPWLTKANCYRFACEIAGRTE